MSAKNRTQGPWEARKARDRNGYPDDHAFDVYPVGDEYNKLHHGTWGHKDVACLIAAAPDLLAACEAALSGENNGYTLSPDTAEALRAAIAKARGAK